VTGDLPEDKLKPLATFVQKHFTTTLKALKFEATENPPKGKLAVYFFPERKKYKYFVGELLNERVDNDERSHSDARAAEPYVAISVVAGEKPTDLDTEAATQIAAGLLACKAGPAMLPGWMKDGFARAMSWRLDAAAGAKDRAQIRRLVLAPKGKKAADIWTAPLDADKKLLGASLMEYFVFGPDSAKFSKILNNFRPTDEVPNPTIANALQAVEITPDNLDKAWKKWVTTGK